MQHPKTPNPESRERKMNIPNSATFSSVGAAVGENVERMANSRNAWASVTLFSILALAVLCVSVLWFQYQAQERQAIEMHDQTASLARIESGIETLVKLEMRKIEYKKGD